MYQHSLKYCLAALLVFSFFIIPFKTSSQWVEQNSSSSYFLTAIYFFNENTGLIGSASPLPITNNFLGGEIIRTTNGGTIWQRVLLDSNLRVRSFYFVDQNTGYAIGGTYISSGKLIKTTNGGLNWFTVIDNGPPLFYKYFYNMYFANVNTGFISNQDGVYKTINGGINWESCLNVFDYNGNYLSYRKLYFFDENKGVYLSDSGKVYKTINSGINWSVNYIDTGITYRDITFLDNNTGYAVGLFGKMIKTTNQGDSWQTISIGYNESFYSIRFVNSLTGYLTKDYGVLKTSDGGITWSQVLSQINDSLFSNFFINSEIGYVAGTKGRVFKTTTGGVLGINIISGEVPREFSLDQNYPNPFNPSTNIKFAIPKAVYVRLAVYDMLGREVESLVNEQLTPGTFEVNWNAAKFSSGIYMYRLVTNDFQMVKKMSLIK